MLRKPSKPLIAVLLILLGGFYWAFLYDPRPDEALRFFFPVDAVADEDNVIYSIAGFAAPAGIDDIRAWGYASFNENRQRQRKRQLLTRWDPVDGAARLVGMRDKGHFCWRPEGLSEAESRHCYTTGEIDVAIEVNRELLARYESIFDYPAMETWHFDDIPLAALLDYTSLYAWRFWRRADALDSDDRRRIFRFFRFWQRLYANLVSNRSDRSLILLNFNRASELISMLAERDPAILDHYAAESGQFTPPIDAQALLDRMYRHEFRTLDALYCLRGRYTDSDECRPRSLRFPGKLGKTIEMMYQQRPRVETCPQEIVRPLHHASREQRRRFFWQDPSNISGRFLLTTIADASQLCLSLREYLVEAEAALLRNFYLEFRRGERPVEQLNRQFATNPVLFANPFSQNEIRWDADLARLVMRNGRFRRELSIAFNAVD